MAVIQAVQNFEAGSEERNFMRGVVQGLLDLEVERGVGLAEVKKRLRLGA